MKVLVCIDNNLKIDSRLKRHVTAIAKVVDEVHVLCRPNPDHEFGLDIPNVSHSFFEIDYSEHSTKDKMIKALHKLNIYEDIENVCPFIQCEYFYDKQVLEEYDRWLTENMQSGRWQDVLKRTPEKMTLNDAMSYVHTFLLSSIFMAKEACNIEADIVLCNDVDTLLCGTAHKKKYGSRVIYDIHDVTCDISPGVFPLMYSKMLMKYEYHLSTYPDVILSVGKHLLKWAQKHYGFKQPCIPIYGCNEKESMLGVLPKKYDMQSPIKIYFHGLAYAARKLDIMVKALKNVENIELVFRCDENPYIEEVRKIAMELHVDNRVHFLQMVSTTDVVRACNQDGDVGIYASIPDGCINWASSFTNKFMEYLGAGLPIITTKAEDQMQIVKKYRCGFILDDDSVESMEKVYKEVLTHRNKLERMSANSWKVARRIFSWDLYEKRLISAVLNTGKTRGKLPALGITERLNLSKWSKEEERHASAFEYLSQNAFSSGEGE